jgi:hypothetical protein
VARPCLSDVASRASAAYGTDMGAVRVHTDSQSAAMAESKGFQAFSYGGDVFGTSSALDTSTVHGQHVMMHELAHVAQTGGQRAGGVHGKVDVGTATDASDALEVDADKGAAAAVAGGSYSVQRAPLAVRGFGATAGRDAHGVRNQRDIVHENQTLHGAQAAGFSAAEGDMMYSGNWNRDMNQLLIPKLRQGHPVLFTAMDLLHTLHFGFPIGGQAGAAPGTSPGRAAVREFGSVRSGRAHRQPRRPDRRRRQRPRRPRRRQRQRRRRQPGLRRGRSPVPAAAAERPGPGRRPATPARASSTRRSPTRRSASTSRASRSTCRPAGPS